ncbi:preprotein translocase subunit YajC [Occultella gossypii]|uniref:Preprotein translocase subunit YajC n=1 Tax=Occultella gossypii TaxID=2800820 RepID=A0ABS7S5W2_9MICO|nr:preprotein translocase subunit YajC [Occultella gossypii]MBZ2195736.1 preprotein translocase subunit YajC [Occultella gossypii]
MDGQSPILLIVLGVAIVGLFWMNSRAKKQQQKKLSFRDSLAPGQEVQTIGGLVGTVTHVEGDLITIATTPGTELRFVRAAIAKLVEPTEADDEFDDEGTEADTEDETAASEQSEGTPSATAAGDRPTGFLSDDDLKKPYRDGEKP